MKSQFQGPATARRLHPTAALTNLANSGDDALEAVISRAAQLKLELESAGIYTEDQFTLKFLDALRSEYEPWVMSMRTQPEIASFSNLTASNATATTVFRQAVRWRLWLFLFDLEVNVCEMLEKRDTMIS